MRRTAPIIIKGSFEELEQSARSDAQIERDNKKHTKAVKRENARKKEAASLINIYILTSIIFAAILLIASFVLYEIYSKYFLSFACIFCALIIAGEALAIPLWKKPSISLSIIAIPALSRIMPLQGNVISQYLPTLIIVLSSILCAALLLRNESIKSRSKFFVEKVIMFELAIVLSHVLIKEMKYSKPTLFLALLICALIPILIPSIVRSVYAFISETNTSNGVDQKIYLSYFVVIFAAVSLGYLYGGATASKVITDMGKNTGVGMSYFIVIFLLIVIIRHPYVRSTKILQNNIETIHGLSDAPELGGIVPPGTAGRTAGLCRAIAKQIGVSEYSINILESCAYFTNIGKAALYETHGQIITNSALASQVTARMLRKAGGYDYEAHLIEMQSIKKFSVAYGQPVVNDEVLADILRIAIDYEETSRAIPTYGLEALDVLFKKLEDGVYQYRILIALRVAVTESHNKHLIDPVSYSYHVTEQLEVLA